MNFTGRARFADQQPAVGNDADPDAGAEGQQNYVVMPLGVAENMLRPYGRISIVFHHHRLGRKRFEIRIHIPFGHVADRTGNPGIGPVNRPRGRNRHRINLIFKLSNNGLQQLRRRARRRRRRMTNNLVQYFTVSVNRRISNFGPPDVKSQNFVDLHCLNSL